MKKGNIKSCTPLLIGWIYLTCFACNTQAPIDESKPNKNKAVAVVTDSVRVQSSIVAFLQWYKTNLNKANNFPLLIKDSNDNFKVNKPAYIDYLTFVQSSNFISPRYIAYWETYFRDKEKELKDHPIKSDVPEGFDFDLILITQEPDLILNKIDSMVFNIVSMTDSSALIEMKLPGDDLIEYEFDMDKRKEGWQISYISTPNYD